MDGLRASRSAMKAGCDLLVISDLPRRRLSGCRNLLTHTPPPHVVIDDGSVQWRREVSPLCQRDRKFRLGSQVNQDQLSSTSPLNLPRDKVFTVPNYPSTNTLQCNVLGKRVNEEVRSPLRQPASQPQVKVTPGRVFKE